MNTWRNGWRGISTEYSRMAIQVTYRKTKRLSMRIVKNGDVHVSAPIGLPREKVMEFIEETLRLDYQGS